MEELTGDRQVATEQTDSGHLVMLRPVTLVTDVQAFSSVWRPYAQLAPQIERLRQQGAGQCVMESSLPEIRALAMLLAARRADRHAARSPTHFADEADWLCARAFLLGLSHVEITLAQMAMFDEANLRLRRLAAHGLPVATGLLPVLNTSPQLPTAPMVLHGWSPLSVDEGEGVVASAAGSPQARALRQRCQKRFALLLGAWRPRP
ncbi:MULTISPECIES: hypothetical protein [unclassified Paludibacterium]|uniref:hypothetical protein n=1 Tax=unclassified Paludibacterium TaxID=2618429 RepID=UPI001C04C214|nr:hypothetical protein [Paludibacterium sp. B53371]BEV72245.1 hypothetical protein THUN1379_17270 [Paludibacterium sp. THUN1379]